MNENFGLYYLALSVASSQKDEEVDKVYYDDEYNVSRWLYSLKRFTFETHFISCSKHFANALLTPSASRTEEQNWHIQDTCQDIDSVIKGNGGGHWFCRLGSRSPKDAVNQTDKMKQILAKHLSKLANLPSMSSQDRQNSEFSAYFSSRSEASAISNGNEAINLLENSERVKEDLIRALKVNPGALEICIRRWCPEVKVDCEFRGFCLNRNLIALSQYNFVIHFPALCLNRNKVLSLATDFWKHSGIRQALPYDDCVVDFVITWKDNENNSWKNVQVLELNPYSKSTSACLFSWNTDSDLLLRGKGRNDGPIVLRLVEQPLPVLREEIETLDDVERIESTMRYVLSNTYTSNVERQQVI